MDKIYYVEAKGDISPLLLVVFVSPDVSLQAVMDTFHLRQKEFWKIQSTLEVIIYSPFLLVSQEQAVWLAMYDTICQWRYV